jgi:biotin synthase-related radical SAM superfamily protein
VAFRWDESHFSVRDEPSVTPVVFLKPCLTDLQVRGKPKADEHDVELDSDEETQGKANAFCPSVDTYRHVLDSLAKALKRYACRLIVGVGTTDTYALRSLQR